MKLSKVLITQSLIALAMLATAACGSPAISATPDLVASAVAGTMQAITLAVSPILPTAAFTTAPTSAPPTVTPSTTPTSLPAAKRLNFATGATQAEANGTIRPGDNLYYVVRAAKGQPLLVSFDTPDQKGTLAIFGGDGSTLLAPSQRWTSWQGLLPNTQDYIFHLIGGDSQQDFTLNVIIAARVEFGAGENRITYQGSTVGGFPVTYVAYAFEDQELEVTVDTDPDDAALIVWGFSDGQPYARAQNGVTDFSLTLPTTQDYIIQVGPQGGRVIEYELTIRIR